jgi:hypothetical protein
MAGTLKRPPVGAETPHDLDFLEGIDLGKAHRRPPRIGAGWIIAVLAILAVVAAVVVALLVTGESDLTESLGRGFEVTAREEGPGLRPRETDVIVLDRSGLDATTASASQRDLGPATSPPREHDFLVPDGAGLAPAAPQRDLGPATSPPREHDFLVPDGAGLAPASMVEPAPFVQPLGPGGPI